MNENQKFIVNAFKPLVKNKSDRDLVIVLILMAKEYDFEKELISFLKDNTTVTIQSTIEFALKFAPPVEFVDDEDED